MTNSMEFSHPESDEIELEVVPFMPDKRVHLKKEIHMCSLMMKS